MVKKLIALVVSTLIVIVAAAALFVFSSLSRKAVSAAGMLSPYKNWGIMNSNPMITHVNAMCAWTITEGSKAVTVAVIDTGVDVTHHDLVQNVRADGWNFVNGTSKPLDDHGHGTHVAGIIGAINDPRAGVTGVTHLVSILPIKYYSDANTGAVNLRNTIKAFEYAVKLGAKIINYSGGGPEFSEDEYLAIKAAGAKGVLVVAAAGNERQNTDRVENYYYPAAYHLPNLIVVTSMDIKGDLLRSANWGIKTVDVAAPGENIYSTLPGGRWGYMTGSSQATAFVSGVAALVLSVRPDFSPEKVKEIIVSTVDKLPGLKNKTISGGKVNACTAVHAAVLDK